MSGKLERQTGHKTRSNSVKQKQRSFQCVFLVDFRDAALNKKSLHPRLVEHMCNIFRAVKSPPEYLGIERFRGLSK